MVKIKKKVGVLLSETDLRKRYPNSGLASEIVLTGDKSLRLPCRSVSINYHLGGGLKYGHILELSGEESTGKTALATDFGVVAQSMGGVVLWDDAEATFDADWASRHGLDTSKVELLPFENEIELVSDWIADMCIFYRSKLTKNEPILLVIDSIALLESGDALETAEMDTKAEMGRRSFKMGSLLRKRMKIFAAYGICVICINQIRKKIGATRFEDPDTTPLSQPMKYYASQRVGLYRGKRIREGGKDKGKWVGNIVYVRTKKNKTSSPRDNIVTQFYFEEDEGKFGYSKYFGLPELLVDHGIVKRRRGVYSYKKEVVAKSDAKFLRVIETNKELRGKWLKRLGTTTPSTLRNKLNSLTKNLYPVKLKVKKDKDGKEESEE